MTIYYIPYLTYLIFYGIIKDSKYLRLYYLLGKILLSTYVLYIVSYTI